MRISFANTHELYGFMLDMINAGFSSTEFTYDYYPTDGGGVITVKAADAQLWAALNLPPGAVILGD